MTAAPVEIRLPQWGMGMREGTVVSWLKQVGDSVAAGEEIVEIETDKVEAMVTCPVDGVLVEILVEAQQSVAVRTVLAVVAPHQ